MTIFSGGVSFGTFWTFGGSTQVFGWSGAPDASWSVLATSPTEGGFWMQQDCSTAPASRAGVEAIALNSSGTARFDTPSGTGRWSAHYMWSWRVDVLPGSGHMGIGLGLAADSLGYLGVDMNNSGKVDLTVRDTGTAIYSSTRATGSAILSTATEYLFDLWIVLYDSVGTQLTFPHAVLRVWSSAYGGAAPTLVDTIHYYYTSTISATNRGDGIALGDWSTTNFGSKQLFGHLTSVGEDADHPVGQLRSAWYKPTALGTTHTYTTGGGGDGITAVSSAPPVADASVVNYISGINGNKQLYKTTAQTPGTLGVPGASDTPYFIMHSWRDSYAASKGSTCTIGEPTLFDGTNTRSQTGLGNEASGGSPTGPYNSQQLFWTLNAASGNWATANLGGGASENQFGLLNSSTGGTDYIDCMHYFAAWVKSGETLAAVPGPDTQISAERPFIVDQAVKRGSFY